MSNTSQASNRISSLLDENSFVEIGAMVTARSTDFNMNPKEAPADGVVTGYGLIDGDLVYVYSQDAAVMGGSVGEMHAKKISRLYDMAMKMGAPVIGLIDSSGLRLMEASDALNAFSRIYRKQAMASGVIPQISAVFGSCGGGLAISASLADFTFIEAKKGKLFVSSPNAIAGNYEEKLDTAAAAFQAEESGNADFVCEESEIYSKIRELVSMLPSNNEDGGRVTECQDDLNRTCANLAGFDGDVVSILQTIADDNNYLEVKSSYAKDMSIGFIRLNGTTVGCVANAESVLKPYGCLKAADFINFCDAFDIPLLSLTNVTGFGSCIECEKRIADAAAKLTFAFANADVPKVNLVIGKAFGSAYSVMNSSALGCDVTFAWEKASIGMMDADLAASVICEGKDEDARKVCADEYKKLQNSVDSAARRGYVDSVINADDSRKYLIGAFEMLYTKREDRPIKKHGAV